jgi:hypothetical protein
MTRYNRIMAAVCLTLGAILMTVTLVGIAYGVTTVHRIADRLSHIGASSAPYAPTTDAPADVPTTAVPSPTGDTMARCRAAFTANDWTTYGDLKCGLYGN